MPYSVYIMASQKNGALYIGVTNNIRVRAYAHKDGRGSSFTVKYNVHRLVHIEYFDQVNDAIARENDFKKWRRQWKIDLIESVNPDWDDLYLKLNQ